MSISRRRQRFAVQGYDRDLQRMRQIGTFDTLIEAQRAEARFYRIQSGERQRPLEREDHTLYRCFAADGGLLYVGIARSAIRRLHQHETSKDWWPEVATIAVEHYVCRSDALTAEAQAIAEECPAHNVQHAQKRAQRPRPLSFATEKRELLARLAHAEGVIAQMRTTLEAA